MTSDPKGRHQEGKTDKFYVGPAEDIQLKVTK